MINFFILLVQSRLKRFHPRDHLTPNHSQESLPTTEHDAGFCHPQPCSSPRSLPPSHGYHFFHRLRFLITSWSTMVSDCPPPYCRCCLIGYPTTSATMSSSSSTLSSQFQPLSTPRQPQARNVIPQFLDFSVYPSNRLTPRAEVSHFSHGDQEVLDGMFSVNCR